MIWDGDSHLRTVGKINQTLEMVDPLCEGNKMISTVSNGHHSHSAMGVWSEIEMVRLPLSEGDKMISTVGNLTISL